MEWHEDWGEFETLLRACGCSEPVVDHCRAVCELALTFSNHSFINLELVRAGAMLHDIGRGRTHALPHGQVGAELCREKGLPEEIALIVERHIGAGLTADECLLLNLMPRDCMPHSIEEKIIVNADNLVKGTTEISIWERLLSSPHLPRKVRKRMFRLALEMELFR